MKKLCLVSALAVATLQISSVGQAADMSAPAPVMKAPPPVALFSWTGFYVGANIGGAWAQRNVTDTLTGLTFSNTSNAVFMGGGQLGFNYQINNFLVGVEGDIEGLTHNNTNGTGVIVPGVGTVQVTNNSTWISTIAARFGLAFDHWLFYGKAGAGWVGSSNFTISNLTTGTAITGTNSSNSNIGFLGGVGIEYAITNNWTVKAEYDFLGLGSRTFAVPIGSPFLVGDTFTNGSRNVQTAKVGFNYLFNGGSRY